ncbi:fimbrial biogenesis chaperone [Hydrogenophaga sp. BPS33]|uniref:fimbrial biogenesis chaperone n=1 Tax=Hydrogenophaga sp. BPS33 TaxID=2651974 RepID=UPI00131FA605|nr:fimbria/pilus periplasmic chaperone [Hydrogenophaga sp. BPS33]QHE87184.1 molecular chaperone [Hydrogenophaga sp. BPS33]
MYRFSLARCTACVRELAPFCVTVWAAALVLPVGVAAAQVLIQPVVVELSARQRVASVAISLSSKAASPLRLQADVLSWTQDLNGRPVTEYTDDILVTPPLVEIRPGERQVFRLAFRGPRTSTDELAYRLKLEDISAEKDAAEVVPGMQISFRSNYDLPVLAAPVGTAAPLLRWKPCPGSETADVALPGQTHLKAPTPRATATCIRVLNDGTRRVKVNKLMLSGDGWQEMLTLKNGETVLVGTEREWRVPRSPGSIGTPSGVQIETAQGTTLKAEAGGF